MCVLQDPEGAYRDTTPSPPPAGQREDEGGYLLLGEDLSYTKLLLQVDGAGYVVDRFTRLLAAELASIDREHANLMLTAYAAIATNCLSELPLSVGERKEVRTYVCVCVCVRACVCACVCVCMCVCVHTQQGSPFCDKSQYCHTACRL